jgi:hypothetical protein
MSGDDGAGNRQRATGNREWATGQAPGAGRPAVQGPAAALPGDPIDHSLRSAAIGETREARAAGT